ncbi:MAG TPA: ABC transporter permease [Gemmatimonadaceae bacterium]|nr:ABC transporter permease [Gemmatimonadaceae bacterium]
MNRFFLAVYEGMLIAVDAIKSNKVRAGLTILGIAVGVFVVTAMSAAVHGINEGVSASLAAAGPKTFYVTRWPMSVTNCNGSADSCPWRHNKPLTVAEATAIGALSSVHAIIVHVNTTALARVNDRSLSSVNVDAYTPGWTEVDPSVIDSGRTFTQRENDGGSHVALINSVVAEDFFPTGPVIGQSISLDNEPYHIIGVYHQRGNLFDPANKPKVVVPFETSRRSLKVDIHWLDLTVKPKDDVERDVAMDDVTATLRVHRGLRPDMVNTFFIYGNEKVMEVYNQTVLVFFLVMLLLSAIGLLVGGVGVVAIMMISVTERTREIGVRKALGATRGAILWQFLVEAATLTMIGAVIGLVGGGLASWLIRSISPVEASIPPLAIVASLGMSAITGVLFGLFPAFRAARLDPVIALRYE